MTASTQRFTPARWLVTAVLANLSACGGSAADQAVENSLPQWTLTETLRLGGAETGPSSFNFIKGIAVDRIGHIFLYDRPTQEIRAFNADGTLDRVLTREGSGPGELRNAEGIAFASDGVLWARDAANGRFALFDASGDPLATLPMTFCSSQGMWAPLAGADGRILDVDCARGSTRAVGDLVMAYGLGPSGVDTLGPPPTCGSETLADAGTWITPIEGGTSYRTIPYRPINLRVLASDSSVWCVPNSSEYVITKLPLFGIDTVHIAQVVAPVPVTAQERDSVIAAYEATGPTGLDFSRIPANKPVIERLIVDDKRQLWVQRNSVGGVVSFDIFSSEGDPIATAELGTIPTATFYPLVIQHDHLYVVVRDADDVQQVVRFSVTR